MRSRHKGFTIIELLVVVAIIGLLSSVVLASLRTARLKAADARIQEQVLALRSLMQLEFSDLGHYSNFKAAGAWKAAGTSCTAASFGTSPYAAKAAELCTDIVRQAGSTCGSACLYFSNVAIPGKPPGSGYHQNNPPNVISIQAYLPGKTHDAAAAGSTRPRYLCLSSFGNTSIADGAAWTEVGCQQNP
jgi:prepilin-type N-terminal cleavage/methylation domain-containing protein